MHKQLLIVLFLTGIVASCETYPQDEYQEQYVVEAYLVANRQLPSILLSKTVRADVLYDFEEQSINNASIEVQLLESGPNSAPEQIFTYQNQLPGIYIPNPNHKVLPTRTYQLKITFPYSDDIVTAYTVVPDTFRVVGEVQDTVEYQSPEQLELTLTQSSYPGRQNIYVFNALAQNIIPQNLTPFYKEVYDESETPEQELESFSNNSSGIINEGNFELNPNGSFTFDFPWIGIAFYQENFIVANTIDDNIYDFIRSQETQLGGSTFSPGQIQNVIYRMNGGIGIFGSLATDTVKTFVELPVL
ncbi:DUF4249 family protein [Gracilimonas sp.]|uniref:DUF4249 family protein n=1 Tax=Gracilimonas sp. TaxID=1974203 RepID=UPI002872A59B|nr:DUF4249 family protein [Gracilimonas sp.]